MDQPHVGPGSLSVYILSMCVAVPLTGWALLNVFKWRSHPALKLRSPIHVLVSLSAFGLATVRACLRGAEVDVSSHCVGYWGFQSLCATFVFPSIALRMWHLWYSYSIRTQLVKWHHESSSLDRPWHAKSRFQQTVVPLVSYCVSAMFKILPLFVLFGTGKADPFSSPTSPTCIDERTAFLALDLPVRALLLAAMGYLFFKLRGVEDNFQVRREMISLSAVFVAVGLCMVVLYYIPGNGGLYSALDDAFPGSDLGRLAYVLTRYVIPDLCFVWLAGFRPVQLCKALDELDRQDREEISKLLAADCTMQELRTELKAMLDDPQGFELLKAFLMKEFSIENALFYKDALAFKNVALGEEGADTERVRMEGKKVFDTYIAEHSLMPINLPSYVSRGIVQEFVRAGVDVQPSWDHARSRRAVLREMMVLRAVSRSETQTLISDEPSASASTGGTMADSRLSPTVFDDALVEVVNLVTADSFGRFRRTTEYRNYLLTKVKPQNQPLQSALVKEQPNHKEDKKD